MNWNEWLPWLIGVNCIVLMAGTSHLTKDSGRKGRAVSSLIVFPLTFFIVSLFGFHKCDDGTSPAYIAYTTALLSASLPWIGRLPLWLGKTMIAVLLTSGAMASSYLSSSYHREDITGNDKYSSGRFWHTPFTGQYPRDKSKTPRFRPSETISSGFLPFDPVSWGTDRVGRLRWRMHEDLLRQHDLSRMTTNEIVRVLGPPERRETLPYYMDETTILAYYIGPPTSETESYLVIADEPEQTEDGARWFVRINRPATILD
ncbi:MAG: hypothetical protein AAF492_02815 [Verrucomicrobiota bacterium]